RSLHFPLFTFWECPIPLLAAENIPARNVEVEELLRDLDIRIGYCKNGNFPISPFHLFDAADNQHPRQRTANADSCGDREWGEEFPGVLQHESGERRPGDAGKVCEAILPAVPLPYCSGPGESLRESVQAG